MSCVRASGGTPPPPLSLSHTLHYLILPPSHDTANGATSHLAGSKRVESKRISVYSTSSAEVSGPEVL